MPALMTRHDIINAFIADRNEIMNVKEGIQYAKQ